MDILCKEIEVLISAPAPFFLQTPYTMKLKLGLCGGKQASVYLS
jgi:hypothetical protein